MKVSLRDLTKNRPALLKLLPLFLLFFTIRANALTVTGNDSVCAHSLENYSVPGGAGTYTWLATGHSVITGVNTSAATILWGNAGIGTIIVTTTNPANSYTLTVVINPIPSPAITHAPYPGCPSGSDASGSLPQHEAGSSCEKVCKGATVTYTTALHAGSTYQWIANGYSVLTPVNNSATVTWDTTSFGWLTVIETNQFGCKDSSRICIEKVSLPVAYFTHQASACRFTSVLFTNLSTNSTSWQWYFGDGGSSTIFSPSHSYSTAGNYTITLIAYNNCHCVDTFTSTIHIDSMPGPVITCPSTVCAFDTAMYSITGGAGCIYNWFAIGGTILGPNNQTSVNVIWGAGQLGQLGVVVTGCNSLCSDTSWVYVPIVPATAVISGPNKICAGDCATFTLPRFSGAGYTWTLNSNCGGTTGDTVCCEKVEVCYPPYANCNDTLFVAYYDTFLGCGGSGMKIIRVRPHLTILGNTTVCANTLAQYNAINPSPVTCQWSISPSGPTIIPGGVAPIVNINWNNLTGTFVLTAYPVPNGQVCDDSVKILITVVAPPVKPIITGDTVVCKNSSVQYCAISAYTVNWIITGGTPVTSVGNCVTVSWGNTPPFIVRAYQTMPNSPFCNSDTTTQNIYPILSLPNPNIIGVTPACANSTNAFSTTTLYPSGTTYTWSVTPTNSGAVTVGQGSPNCSVQWGNNAPQNVTVTLTVNACGQTGSTNYPVSLNPAPVVSVVQIGNLCAGGSAQLQASGGATYSWSGPSGYTSASNPTTILLSGLYQVTGTDLNGCTALSQINVQYVSGPSTSISTLNYLNYCIGAPISVTMCAIGNVNYSYAWSGGGAAQCRTYTSAGTYAVTVTDITNGCTVASNFLTITVDSCNGGGPGNCTSNGSVSFNHTQCNPISFFNTSVNTNGFYTWQFGDTATSSLVNPTHHYNQAGFYVVTLTAWVYNTAHTDSCLMSDTAQIEIPIVAAFDIHTGCYNDPVCFTDISTHTAGNNITGWYWDFGDGNNSGTQSPCHTYATSGTYFVTLVITNGTCFDTIMDTVFLLPRPNAAFSFSNPNCINNAVIYTDLSTTNITYWNWSFGDGGTSLNQNPQHTYGLPGSYLDTLIVHDNHGCWDTTIKSITINAPVNYGPIWASDTIVCAGTSVLLVAPPCGTCTYLWSTGATNDSITVNATGIYTVSMNDGSGCLYTTYIKIIVNNGPPAIIQNSGHDELCFMDQTQLFVTNAPNWIYQWISNDPNANGQTTPYVYVYSGTPVGTYNYQVIITDTTTGCSDTSLPYIIIINPLPVPPVITAGGPTTICFGDTTILIGTHPDPTITFLWNTGSINDSLWVTVNGCYTLTVKDTNGCKNNAQLCVTVNPLPDLCTFYEGCFDTCRPYTIRGPGGGSTYLWLLNGVSTGVTTQNYVNATISGSYSVIVTNSFGCTDTTGDLNLTLYDCPDSLCAHLVIDSTGCDSLGHHVVFYHVFNESQIPITQLNLEILPPHLNMAFAPNLIFMTIPGGGGSSGPLSAVIYNAQDEDTVCFRAHISSYDSMGHQTICCYSDTECVVLPPCPHDTASCCYFHFLGDSTWCSQSNGTTVYNFQLHVNGCGTLQIQTGNNTSISGSNPIVMTGNNAVINGTYTPSSPSDTVVCITFVMSHNNIYCADTTICINLHCSRPGVPVCNLHFEDSICVGQTTSFNYAGNPAGLTFNWQFPGGSPSTATGPGPHYVTYNTVGCHQVICMINNNIDCLDTICVLPPPVASITQTGNTLLAYPSGYSYQWYTGNPGANPIGGAINQFLTPGVGGFYCVVVYRNAYCSDTACIDFTPTGIEELGEKQWTVYPNPNEGAFTLSVSTSMGETVELRVTNAMGELVDRRVYETHAGENHYYISNSSFSAGIYFVQLKTEKGMGMKRMMVK